MSASVASGNLGFSKGVIVSVQSESMIASWVRTEYAEMGADQKPARMQVSKITRFMIAASLPQHTACLLELTSDRTVVANGVVTNAP